MKRFLLTLLAIGGFVFLLFGYMYWQDRTAVSSGIKDVPEVNSESDDSGAAQKEDASFYSNWPEEAQADYKEAVKNDGAYKIAIVGSGALGKGQDGWSEQLKAALSDAGGDTIEMEIFQYEGNSLEFINGAGAEEVTAYAPDMILYEPFALNDNSSGVLVEDRHDGIEMFMNQLKEANEDAVLVLQPTHPLFGSTYYPKQVGELKEFAKEKGFAYLNHWEAWPDDESSNDLLVESKEASNAEGHTVWADYLIEYFVAD